jgi:hypothetical protein
MSPWRGGFRETRSLPVHPSRNQGTREWLEADGLGGFASGTVDTVRTRRYHDWQLSARTPSTGRTMLGPSGSCCGSIASCWHVKSRTTPTPDFTQLADRRACAAQVR